MTGPMPWVRRAMAPASGPQRVVSFQTRATRRRPAKRTGKLWGPGPPRLRFGDSAGAPGSSPTLLAPPGALIALKPAPPPSLETRCAVIVRRLSPFRTSA